MPWALLWVLVAGLASHSSFWGNDGPIHWLPVAWPLMIVYYALRFGATRMFSIMFFFLSCSLCIWIDSLGWMQILAGSTYAIAGAFGTDLAWNWKLKRAGIDMRSGACPD